MGNVTIKKVSSNLGTSWELVVIDPQTGREMARYKMAEVEIDKSARSMRRTIERHLQDGGTLYNYQW